MILSNLKFIKRGCWVRQEPLSVDGDPTILSGEYFTANITVKTQSLLDEGGLFEWVVLHNRLKEEFHLSVPSGSGPLPSGNLVCIIDDYLRQAVKNKKLMG